MFVSVCIWVSRSTVIDSDANTFLNGKLNYNVSIFRRSFIWLWLISNSESAKREGGDAETSCDTEGSFFFLVGVFHRGEGVVGIGRLPRPKGAVINLLRKLLSARRRLRKTRASSLFRPASSAVKIYGVLFFEVGSTPQRLISIKRSSEVTSLFSELKLLTFLLTK